MLEHLVIPIKNDNSSFLISPPKLSDEKKIDITKTPFKENKITKK
jgi:hypothetical protein